MSRPYRHKRPSPGADLKWHDKAACKPEAILELGQVVDWEYQLSLFYSERDRGAERAPAAPQPGTSISRDRKSVV